MAPGRWQWTAMHWPMCWNGSDPICPAPARCAVFDTLTELHAALSCVYDLSMALPDDPLRRFELETRKLPKTTEAERLVVERRGAEHISRQPDETLAGAVPVDGDRRAGIAARQSHEAVGEM